MIEGLIGLLPSLGQMLKESIRQRRLQDERGQRAVERLLRAVNETKLYMATLSRGSQRNLEREAELSRHWTEAAGALHGIDDELAQRCRLKGHYWTSPDEWDPAELKQTKILLDQVSDDADKLLGWGN